MTFEIARARRYNGPHPPEDVQRGKPAPSCRSRDCAPQRIVCIVNSDGRMTVYDMYIYKAVVNGENLRRFKRMSIMAKIRERRYGTC